MAILGLRIQDSPGQTISDNMTRFLSPMLAYNDSGYLTNLTSLTTKPTMRGPPASPYTLWQQVVIAMVLSVIIIGTVLGNSLVCISIIIVRRLRTPSNLLIVSLAVSDLLVGMLVMPFAISLEIMGSWSLGTAVCSMWSSFDILLCTASILNLCVISVDRYFVITRPFQYAIKRTNRHMLVMIAAVWVMSALITIPPLFGWAQEQKPYECNYSNEIGYQIYATFGAFYLPLATMLFVYFRIWRVSSRLAKQERKSSNIGSIDRRGQATEMLPRSSKSSKGSADSQIVANGSLRNEAGSDRDEDVATDIFPRKNGRVRRFTIRSLLPKRDSGTPTVQTNRQHGKATKTLGVIMGCFTLCWLPFFIVALVTPFCKDNCYVPKWLSSVLLWLGFANSTLNPIIYARFNREFRKPFKEILFLRCRGINAVINAENYNDMYGGPAAADPSMRDSLRPPRTTVIRYDSQGHTLVQVGNGSTPASEGETKI